MICIMFYTCYLPLTWLFFSFAYLSVALQLKDNWFSEGSSNTVPMLTALFLYPVSPSALATSIACTTAFTASMTAYIVAWVRVCAYSISTCICVPSKMFACVFFLVYFWHNEMLLTLVQMALVDAWDVYLLHASPVVLVYLWWYNVYTWCTHMGAPFWHITESWVVIWVMPVIG